MTEDKPNSIQSQLAIGALACLIILVILILLPLIFEATDGARGKSTPPEAKEEIGAVLPYSGALHPWLEWGLLAFASVGLLIGVGSAIAEMRRAKSPLPGSDTQPVVRLLVLGATSLAIYAVNFLLPFPLHRYYNLRRIGYAGIAGYAVGPAIGTAVAVMALFLLYYLAYRLSREVNDRRMWPIVLVGALLFGVFNLATHITTSPDMYDYVARGRISGVYGGNPYLQVPDDYPDDLIIQQAGWRDVVSAYGPAWEAWAGLIGRFAGGSLWLNVLGYKGLAFASFTLGVLIIASILRRVDPERSLSGTLLYAWNPLVLMEGVANGHNDVLMVALLLGAFWLLVQVPWALSREGQQVSRAWSLVCGGGAMIFLGVAILTKFVPVLLLPFVVLYLLVPERYLRHKLAVGLLLLIPMGMVFFEYYAVFWQWPGVIDGLSGRANLFRMSVASVVKEMLQGRVGHEIAQTIASWPFLAGFGLSYLVILGRSATSLRHPRGLQERAHSGPRAAPLRLIRRILTGGREGSQESPWDILSRASLSIIVLYLLLASLWFWPWYLTWPVALLSLARHERMVIPLTLASCAGQLSHVAWSYIWWWMGITWESVYRINLAVVVLLVVPPLIAYAIAVLRGKR